MGGIHMDIIHYRGNPCKRRLMITTLFIAAMFIGLVVMILDNNDLL